jgi:hypothetical protein
MTPFKNLVGSLAIVFGIVTRLRAGSFGFRVPESGNRYSSSSVVQTDPAAHLTFYPLGTGVLFQV